jgi:hypothetical protein
MPRDVLYDMTVRQFQWLCEVLAEIPDEKLKTPYAIMIQERMVELNDILFKRPEEKLWLGEDDKRPPKNVMVKPRPPK